MHHKQEEREGMNKKKQKKGIRKKLHETREYNVITKLFCLMFFFILLILFAAIQCARVIADSL